MIITGKTLDLVREALVDAIAHCNNEIGQVPNVHEYAGDITEYEKWIEDYEAMIVRIDKAIAKEGAKQPS